MTTEPERELPTTLKVAHMLIIRLMRLSVDSHWARRSSGLRGSLLREVERLDDMQERGQEIQEAELEHLDGLVRRGFEILEAAAKEIRSIDDLDDLRRLMKP